MVHDIEPVKREIIPQQLINGESKLDALACEVV